MIENVLVRVWYHDGTYKEFLLTEGSELTIDDYQISLHGAIEKVCVIVE